MVDGALFFEGISRLGIQAALQTVALTLGLNASAYTPHSLRFGGASAMWSGGIDSHTLRTWGRWNSDAFLAYLWGSRKATLETSYKMATADMTPIRSFPERARTPPFLPGGTRVLAWGLHVVSRFATDRIHPSKGDLSQYRMLPPHPVSCLSRRVS